MFTSLVLTTVGCILGVLIAHGIMSAFAKKHK